MTTPTTPTGKWLASCDHDGPHIGCHHNNDAVAIEQEARAMERERLRRLYAADALALAWTSDMLAAIQRRLADPEPDR